MQKHWMTAVDSHPGKGDHCLLWVDVEPVKRQHGGDGLAVRAVRRRAWPLRSSAGPPALHPPGPFAGADSLALLLAALARPGKALTVWLARGWEDLVLTGLAELIDRGLYRYRWLTLDGQRVLASGALGKRRVDLTSLAAWTGGEWDGWRSQCLPLMSRLMNDDPGGECLRALREASADEQCALGECLTVLDAARGMCLGAVKLSIGAQARNWWRAWGGPRLGIPRQLSAARTGRGKAQGRVVIAPVPRRPQAAASAESHCCHGLAREQYARGHVGGPVHVLDLQSAYLLALTSVQVPSVFDRLLHAPSIADLADSLPGSAGCALVRLEVTAYPYCVRHHRRPARAVGSYWAWLTEPDLCKALYDGTVAECHSAWLWRHVPPRPRARATTLAFSQQLKAHGLPHLAALWRQLYASCVGGWAQRSWEWLDVPGQQAPARWLTWTMQAANGEDTEYWRSVGGRVQRRVYRGEAPYSLPLFYGTCTAFVRQAVDFLRGQLPEGTVLATACDALWVTGAGLEAFQSLKGQAGALSPYWRLKDSWQDAWLDGKGAAVVRKEDFLYPLLPGIPAGVCIGGDGLASWPRAQEWDCATDVRPDKPLPRRRACWDGGRLVRENDRPLQFTSPFVRLAQRALPERLLLPYDPTRVAEVD